MTDSGGASGDIIRNELRVGIDPAPPSSVAATRGSSPSSSLTDADNLGSAVNFDDETSTATVEPIGIGTQVEENPADQAALVESIVDLGFDRQLVAAAVHRTGGEGGVEAALALILDQTDEAGWEDVEDHSAITTGLMSTALSSAFKMVFVVNSALKMGLGKTAAQVGHGTLALYRALSSTDTGKQALTQWNLNGETKVVLRAETEDELMAIFSTSKQRGLPCYLVQDAGRTQIASGSKTVLSLFGPVEKVDAVTGHLKLV